MFLLITYYKCKINKWNIYEYFKQIFIVPAIVFTIVYYHIINQNYCIFVFALLKIFCYNLQHQDYKDYKHCNTMNKILKIENSVYRRRLKIVD